MTKKELAVFKKEEYDRDEWLWLIEDFKKKFPEPDPEKYILLKEDNQNSLLITLGHTDISISDVIKSYIEKLNSVLELLKEEA